MTQTFNRVEIAAFIAQPGARTIWNAYTDKASALAALDKARKDAQNPALEVMTDIDAFLAQAEAQYMCDAAAIDRETFEFALNELPPLDWRREGVIETFNCSEFTAGRITKQYARYHHMGKDYFLTKPVKHMKRETYIKLDDFYSVFEELKP